MSRRGSIGRHGPDGDAESSSMSLWFAIDCLGGRVGFFSVARYRTIDPERCGGAIQRFI